MTVLAYTADFQIILSRRCNYGCGYCNFPNTPSSPLLPQKQVRRLLRTAARLGAHQVTLSAGEDIDELPEIVSTCRYYGFRSWFEYLRFVCQSILQCNGRQFLFPQLDVGRVPYAELRRLRSFLPVAKLILPSADPTLERKKAHHAAPHKRLDYRLGVLEDFGRVGVAAVTGIIIGIGEKPDSWGEAARAVSAVNRRFGHIQGFSIEPFEPVEFSPMRSVPPVADDVLLTAVEEVRRNLDPSIVLSAGIGSRLRLAADVAKLGVQDIGPVCLGTSDKIFFDVPAHLAEARGELERLNVQLVERLPFVGPFMQAAEVPGHLRDCFSRTRRISEKVFVVEPDPEPEHAAGSEAENA